MKKIKKPKAVKLDQSVVMEIYENNFVIHGDIVGIYINKKHALKLAKFFVASDKYLKNEMEIHKKAKKQ